MPALPPPRRTVIPENQRLPAGLSACFGALGIGHGQAARRGKLGCAGEMGARAA